MSLTMNDLTINPKSLNRNTLLENWSWAMTENMLPVLITSMGDVFAQGESGYVYFIDIVSGTIEKVSNNGQEFQELLTNNKFVNEKIYPARIIEYRENGLILKENEVYSYKKYLPLGGEDILNNIEVSDVTIHISIHGQIHNQIKDLPEGTPISEIKIK